jgi:hypothetical protein
MFLKNKLDCFSLVSLFQSRVMFASEAGPLETGETHVPLHANTRLALTYHGQTL